MAKKKTNKYVDDILKVFHNIAFGKIEERADAEKAISRVLDKMKSEQKYCPTCGQRVKGNG